MDISMEAPQKNYNMTHICKDATMKPITLHAVVNIW